MDCSTTSDVLQATVVLQSGYQRQGGKEKDRKRDGLGEREKDITRGTELYRGTEIYRGGGGAEMDQYLCDHHIKVYCNIEKRKFLAQFQF